MTGPFVRLLGDKGLASRHMRDAEQLLAKVHGVRQATGVPVFALRRLLNSGAIIQAQSFGLIDVITIHAMPTTGSTLQRNFVAARMNSGVVFRHTPSVGGYQGITLPFINVTPDSASFGETHYFKTAWQGHAAYNSTQLAVLSPTFTPQLMLNETSMDWIDAQTYCREYDMHVVISDDRVFIGGVQVLSPGPSVRIIGARMYRDHLAVAYLYETDWLAVVYLNNNELVYSGTLTHDPLRETMPVHPGLTPPFPLPYILVDYIFDFDPTDRMRGTFLLGERYTRPYLTGTEGCQKYALGVYEYVPTATSPEDHFTVEEDSEAVTRRTMSYTATTTFTSTTSLSAGLPETYNPRLPAGLPRATFTSTEYPPEAAEWHSRALTGAPQDDIVTTFVAFGDDYIYNEHSWARTTSGGFSLDRSYDLSVTVAGLPIWTGYGPDGTRYIRKISGTAAQSLVGTVSNTHSVTEACTGVRTDELGGGVLVITYSWAYSGTRSSTESMDSYTKTEDTSCALYAAPPGGALALKDTTQVANVLQTTTNGQATANRAAYKYLVSPHSDKVVLRHYWPATTVNGGFFMGPAAARVHVAGVSNPLHANWQLKSGLGVLGATLNSIRRLTPPTPLAGTTDATGLTQVNGTKVSSSLGGAVAPAGNQGGAAVPSGSYGRVMFWPPHVDFEGLEMVEPSPETFVYPFDDVESFIGAQSENYGVISYSFDGYYLLPYVDTAEFDYSITTGVQVEITEAYVSNRILEGCLYLEPMGVHVVSPFGMWTSSQSSTDGRTKENFLLGVGAENITPLLNAATKAPPTSTALAPSISATFSTSDSALAVALF